MTKFIGGVKVSDIGIGTYGMGGGNRPSYKNDEKDADALQYAYGKGINLIDTAEMYAGGHAEEIVGRAFSQYDRNKLFVTTKVWPTNLHAESVVRSANASLTRLGMKYVDLLLIHWPNSSVPIAETIGAMEKLVDEGKVRLIGVSNFNVKEMEEAMSATKRHDIVANQVEYNLEKKSAEEAVIPFCEKNNLAVIAYTPILHGKISDATTKKVAKSYSTSTVSIALKYVMERSIPIPKSSNRAHIDELLAASKLDLKKEDYDLLSHR